MKVEYGYISGELRMSASLAELPRDTRKELLRVLLVGFLLEPPTEERNEHLNNLAGAIQATIGTWKKVL